MLKSILNNKLAVLIGLLSCMVSFAQPLKKEKLDGVIAVVGDYVILDSDIDNTYKEFLSQEIPIGDISRCQLLGKLLEDKLFAHQAIQDSIIVSDAEINGVMNDQVNTMIEQIGSVDKLVKYYNKKNLEEFKSSFYDIIKENKLASGMRSKIIDEVDITPEEVRQFFVKIPQDSLPVFGTDVEMAQIVIKPKVSEEAKQAVINRLKELRQEVLDGGSFFSKAVLYSEDPGSKSSGGFYKMNRKTQFIKEFKDIAFSLEEGEISEPFETEYGYHIIFLEKVKGQDLEIRHILMAPKVPMSALYEARTKAEEVRQEILDGKITFAEAAKKYSDEKETKQNGGLLVKPRSLESRFELTKLDPGLYSRVSEMKLNDITLPYVEADQSGSKYYKIMTLVNRIEEHKADYSKDYSRIKDLALNSKQKEAIETWVKKTIKDSYIYVAKDYKDCAFQNNWLKK